MVEIFLPKTLVACWLLVLLMVSKHTVGAIGEAVPCPEGCTKFGNCNAATGECECPFGRTGKTCEEDLLPACRLTPDSHAYCGHVWIKPCQCIEQCRKYLCQGNECDAWINLNPGRHCFEREGINGAKGMIDPPFENETSAKYYRFALDRAQYQEISYKEAMVHAGSKEYSLPLDECPDRCSENGACIKYTDDPNGTPRCFCFHGYQGSRCEVQNNVCPSKCSDRGTCKDFFCHCEPPYWGVGCGKDTPYLPTNKSKTVDGFKIYAYDLPAWLAYQHAYYAGWQDHDRIYVAYREFLNQLLRSSVLTQNPNEADLFYVPSLTYAYTSNLGNPNYHTDRVIRYIREKYPYWNRTDGRDHILWMPGDRYVCYLQSAESQSAIKLTHFGFFDNTAGGQFKSVISNVNNKWGCYHPLRDVVTAPNLNIAGDFAADTYVNRPNSVENPLPNRTNLLLFAGGVRPGDPEYSGGTRQLIAEWVDKWNDSEIVFRDHVDNYPEAMRGSKFCLAPYGHGWGIRMNFIMTTGCVPVIIQENVFQPFEDVLPYEEFSIRLNNEDIPSLPQILRSVSQETLESLQKGVSKYWPAFVWPSEQGGRAFDYTILSLRRRHMNLKSKYFGHHQPDLF